MTSTDTLFETQAQERRAPVDRAGAGRSPRPAESGCSIGRTRIRGERRWVCRASSWQALTSSREAGWERSGSRNVGSSFQARMRHSWQALSVRSKSRRIRWASAYRPSTSSRRAPRTRHGLRVVPVPPDSFHRVVPSRTAGQPPSQGMTLSGRGSTYLGGRDGAGWGCSPHPRHPQAVGPYLRHTLRDQCLVVGVPLVGDGDGVFTP